MKKIIGILVVLMFLSIPVIALAVVIEDDANIFKGIDQGAIEVMVRIVKRNGYVCNSVSAVTPMVLSRGFTLYCNKYSYEYTIEDKGGYWVLTGVK